MIKRFELDFSTTLPYFLDHIDSGKMLSTIVINKTNFHEGCFFTLLPANTEINSISKLSSGGIIPSIHSGISTYQNDSSSKKYQWVKIETMDAAVSDFMNSYNNVNNRNCTIVENYMLESNSLHTSIKNVKIVSFNNEVYYFLNRSNTIEEINKTIRKSNDIWRFLSVMTAIDFPLQNTLEIEHLNHICDNPDYIVTGAYDGEGYIFWEKL